MQRAGPVEAPEGRAASATVTPPRWLERLVTALDDAVRIPGTNLRVGADAILGLIAPGIGDAAGVLAALAVIWCALEAGVPRTTVARMVANIAIDGVLGAIPFAGDLFDFAFKANRRNLALLEAHRLGRRRTARARDYAFFAFIALIVVVLAALPVLAVVWLVR